jgi:hypothetical protein
VKVKFSLSLTKHHDMKTYWGSGGIAPDILNLCTGCRRVKVKLSLSLTKHHDIKTYWVSGGIAPDTLNLGTRCRRVVILTPRPLYPATDWIWGWMGPTPALFECYKTLMGQL